jgi:hypothetical protein
VTSLITQEVKAIKDVGRTRQDGSMEVYEVNVKADPFYDHPELGTNKAHAKIVTMPNCRTDKEFAKLRRSLARMASKRGWLIKPADMRSS